MFNQRDFWKFRQFEPLEIMNIRFKPENLGICVAIGARRGLDGFECKI